MVGTSNESLPEMAIEMMLNLGDVSYNIHSTSIISKQNPCLPASEIR